MTRKIISLLAAAFLAFVPANAQSSRAAAAEAAAPKTGIRFVVCSPTNAKLPSPLYYQTGKEFKPVRIGGRTPSPRIKPIGGKVCFWDQDPSASAEDDKGKGKGKASGTPDIPPTMTVEIPASVGSKALCIVVPGEKPSQSQTFFMSESEFPARGIHLINFSSAPLQMVTSQKGDFSDKKASTIHPFKRSEGISKSNSWSYSGENGEIVAYMLNAKQPGEKELKRIKMSKFIVSNRQAQITIVVKAPNSEALRMLSIQLTD
ncbi:MAG: hypothetical protein IJO34_01475 [Akkermansia sp.]|nr:hypothetical protein [Akkermansia sp.]